ncbi:MAG: carboxylating nicotinate-nucleotide diphosphorylase, partial [Gemmatimonadetes bacterium]|nr:carboxylating nicotinate-nucleotide diphosphorylase [Gemmatimonadota bacterium]
MREDLDGHVDVSADVTAAWVMGTDNDQQTTARILSRQAGVVAGLDVATHVFERLDPQARLTAHTTDGTMVDSDEIVLEIRGSAQALVVAERTALNFLQRLGGIATLTRRYVDAIQHTTARITDTRKTTPGLRHLERHAVRCGGGVNHRYNLADAVLIKENHVAAAGGVLAAIERAQAGAIAAGRPETRIMCETETLDQVRELIAIDEANWPDRILLDNMPPGLLAEAVSIIREEAGTQIEIEATGGMSRILPDATRDKLQEIPWLYPHFADENGRMRGSIHALVVETPDRTIVVDT